MLKKLSALACLVFLFAGCGKEAPVVSKVVKKVECYQGGKLEYGIGYEYDSKGQLTDIVNFSTIYDHSRTFYYSPESITILGNRGACIININKAGIPEKIVSGSGIVMCSYGSDGYLSRFDVNSGDTSYSLATQVQNGNFTVLHDFEGNALKYTYTQYENQYSIDLNNVPQISNMFTMFNTMKIQGMYSKNLIKSIEVGDTSYYFTYNFDKDGRVTDMIVVSTASENSLTEHYKFTY